MTYQMTTRQTFVLFPIGEKRFAVPADQVNELAPHQKFDQQEQQRFPHTTPLLTGVVVRRNQIVPVADVAPVLIGPQVPARRFYLIVSLNMEGDANRMAIPVSGECELADAEQLPLTGKLPPYVSGLLSIHDEIIEVLNLDLLMSAEVHA